MENIKDGIKVRDAKKDERKLALKRENERRKRKVNES